MLSRIFLNSPCVRVTFLKGVGQTTHLAIILSICTYRLWILDIHLSDRQMRLGRFDVYMNRTVFKWKNKTSGFKTFLLYMIYPLGQLKAERASQPNAYIYTYRHKVRERKNVM